MFKNKFVWTSTDRLLYGIFIVFIMILVVSLFSDFNYKRLLLIQKNTTPEQFSTYLNLYMIQKIIAIVVLIIVTYKMITMK